MRSFSSSTPSSSERPGGKLGCAYSRNMGCTRTSGESKQYSRANSSRVSLASCSATTLQPSERCGSEVTRESVDLEQRLELAGFDEEERARIRGPVPAKPYDIDVGWYVARKPRV